MFDEMISRKLIEWIWVGWTALVVLGGLISAFTSGSFLLAIVILLLTALAAGIVRVICEGLIIIFKIHENLHRSANALEDIQRFQPSIISKLSAPLVAQVAPATAVATGRTTSAPVAAVQLTAPPAGYHKQPEAVHERPQQPVRESLTESRSRLGEWPGSNSGKR